MTNDPTMGASPALSAAESATLAGCEALIGRGLQTFLEVGSALLRIREGRLYRATHGTFEDYCRGRWGMARSHAYRLMDTAAVIENLSPIGGHLDNERQARPLAPLAPQEQREAWTRAVATAPDGKPTAAHIAVVVADLFRRREPPGDRADPPPDGVRIIHGDCLPVLATLPEASVDAVVTDPPWGIGYEHGARARRAEGRGGRGRRQVRWPSIAGDDAPDGRWLAGASRVLKEGSALYLTTRWDVEPAWRELLRAAGFRVVQRLTWHKWDHGKGDLRGTWATTCEDVLFASKGRHVLNGRPSMLLDVGGVPTWEERFHPHQKPVPLAGRLIEASTRPGDLVLDPFAGSGFVPLACLESGRRCIAIESDPHYVATIGRRLRAGARG